MRVRVLGALVALLISIACVVASVETPRGSLPEPSGKALERTAAGD